METNRISALRNVVNAAPSRDAAASPATPIDVAFLEAQTFADPALEREVLDLFVAQARRVVPSLPDLAAREQRDAAHLLKGSSRGIGAWAAAAMAESYELAEPASRAAMHADLAATFAAVEAAIAARLREIEVPAGL